jgi:ferrous iron transport protein A
MDRFNLAQMKQGDTSTIVEIKGGYGLIKKLENLGLRTGIKITKVSSQLIRGPITIQVGNSQVAVGFGMAQKIILEQSNEKE